MPSSRQFVLGLNPMNVIFRLVTCDVKCPSVHHWFPTKSKPFDPNRDCSLTLSTINRCGIIFPEHLQLFDAYVSGFKLQGREYTTDAIKYLCHFYFYRTKYQDFIAPFLREYMIKEIKEFLAVMSPEEYYNTMSSYVQTRINACISSR